MKAIANRQEKGSGREIPGTSPEIFRAQSRRQGQRGFTLVELLAVMAIIGILAGMVAGTVSGLGATGVSAQIASDTKTIENGADRFFNDAFPQVYPVAPLPVDQTDLGVRAIDFDARLPQNPRITFTPDFIKNIPDSAALVSYRIETRTGNVFAAADGADFAPPASSRFDVTQTNKDLSVEGSPQTSDVTFDLTMRKNRAAVEIIKVQIPAGYGTNGASLGNDLQVGELKITFLEDNPWLSGETITLLTPVLTTASANNWDITVDYFANQLLATKVAGVLTDPTAGVTDPIVLLHKIEITPPALDAPGSLLLTIDRSNATADHNRATEEWSLTIFGVGPDGGNLITNPRVKAVYRWVTEEHSTIQVTDVFNRVAGKQAIVIKPGTSGGDTTGPGVTMVPVNGASNVPVNADIVLTFSELIQEASLLPNFTLLRDGATVGVTGNITFDGPVATFNPDSNLDLFSSYTVTVGSGVLDLSGNPLEPTFTSTFVTSSTSP